MKAFTMREVLADTKKAVKNGVKFFFCNTNRGWEDGVLNPLEKRMLKRGYAAAWKRFNFPSHMDSVKKGDVIFMYANGIGFIAVGLAEGSVEKLEPQRRGRLRNSWTSTEWRIKMEPWFKVLPEDKAICWPSATLYRNKTFINLTGEKYKDEYEDMRIAISKAFLKAR